MKKLPRQGRKKALPPPASKKLRRKPQPGFRYMRLGARTITVSPADHPEPLKCIRHLVVPIVCIVADAIDVLRMESDHELKRVAELAAHLRECEQLFPVRLVCGKDVMVDPNHNPDMEGNLYHCVSGLRIVRAMREAGRSHVRAEVMEPSATIWPARFETCEDAYEFEQQAVSLYYEPPPLIPDEKASQRMIQEYRARGFDEKYIAVRMARGRARMKEIEAANSGGPGQ